MTKRASLDTKGFTLKSLHHELFRIGSVENWAPKDAAVFLEVKPGEQAPNFLSESVRLRTLRQISDALEDRLASLDDAAYGAISHFKDEVDEEADALLKKIETWTRFFGGTAYLPLAKVTVLDGDDSPADSRPIILLGVSE